MGQAAHGQHAKRTNEKHGPATESIVAKPAMRCFGDPVADLIGFDHVSSPRIVAPRREDGVGSVVKEDSPHILDSTATGETA